MDRLHRAYRRAESQLISVLESRKGEVKVMIKFKHCIGLHSGVRILTKKVLSFSYTHNCKK